MQTSIDQIKQYLCCPEDGKSLEYEKGAFRCPSCRGHFPIWEDRIVDLRPREPATGLIGTGSEYSRTYCAEFVRSFEWSKSALGWGAPEIVPARWYQQRLRQAKHVLASLERCKTQGPQVICDLGAGAGHYTLAYASVFQYVLHCDVSVDSLLYTLGKARTLGLHNIFFLRIDYLRPPFYRSIDRVTCLDSLERGETHERLLLSAICRSLAPRGVAIVDFHNWWHNPLRRLGLLRQNFGENRSYRRSQAEHLLREAGVVRFRYLPFYQEFEADSWWGGMACRLLPPTRHIYHFSADG